MLLAFKLKQSDLAEQIQSAGELDDKTYKKMVQINNDFQKALMTPVTIASFDPTYDSESNITEEDINLDSASQTRNYTYDDENQILTADTPNVDYTYTYDQRNNRLTQRIVSTSPALDTTDYYTYNKEDELTAWERQNTQTQAVLESYTFVYDETGDCISQTKTSVTPNEVTEYEYYVGGNLKQVTLPDATEIEYLYDANSNRIQKINATEIIDYHYSGSELKSEVHKNKQNNNVLYTLTYYPYGFEKTVGQTTTPYYYIYDNRGFVWALTDDGGDIVETYDYSPYGELLSTPTLTNHLFLSGADQCIYDEETKMVHLNNRYYIPKIGRFLQRDSVEGSPTSTISQNLYTYCQNSPITLIDPSGNSPQNTGTPPRTETINTSTFAGDLSCYMPDIITPVVAWCSSEPIPIDYESMMIKAEDAFGTYSACSGDTKTTSVNEDTGLPTWEIRNSDGQVIAEDKGDGTGPHFYYTDRDGYLLDENCEKILGNDKDYESKRFELTNIMDIEDQIKIIGNLGYENNISGTATFNGTATNYLIGLKLDGDRWIGFSIGSDGQVAGFDQNDLQREFSKDPGLFGRIKTGSFVTMELRNQEVKNGKKEQTWDIYQYHRVKKNGKYRLERDLLTVYGYTTHIQWSYIFHRGYKIRKSPK